MTEFNRMTIVAAAEVISDFNSHDDIYVLEVQWGINGRYSSSSKSGRIAGLASIAADDHVEVLIENGRVSLARALVETAIKAPPKTQHVSAWRKLLAGLRFDGFELVARETEIPPRYDWLPSTIEKTLTLQRMLPADLPGLDFREAESELITLLSHHGFHVAIGHLSRALSAFRRGEWSGANGELRNFFESYLDETAVSLGCLPTADSKTKRDFLGTLVPPFLLSDYNEWNVNNQRPQFVQGLMSRMHPHGGHAGLSEEEDATFRLQITLITARLFLRRLDQRKSV